MALVIQNLGYVCNIVQYELTCLTGILQRLKGILVRLSAGTKGTIITTNVPEKRCVLEAYQILNEVREALVVFRDGLRLECTLSTSACAGPEFTGMQFSPSSIVHYKCS